MNSRFRIIRSRAAWLAAALIALTAATIGSVPANAATRIFHSEAYSSQTYCVSVMYSRQAQGAYVITPCKYESYGGGMGGYRLSYYL